VASFKRPSLQEELEWRLVIGLDPLYAGERTWQVQFAAHDGHPVPYVDLDVSPRGSVNTSPVAEVVCGPIESIRGAVLSTVITERNLPVGAAVGHAAAELSDVREPVENDDLVTFTATFASGATGTLSASRVAFGLANSLGFELFTTAGAATFDLGRASEFGFSDRSADPATSGMRQVPVGPAR